MSTDNYLLLRKNAQGRFVLTDESASCVEPSEIENPEWLVGSYVTHEEASRAAIRYLSDNIVEYGLHDESLQEEKQPVADDLRARALRAIEESKRSEHLCGVGEREATLRGLLTEALEALADWEGAYRAWKKDDAERDDLRRQLAEARRNSDEWAKSLTFADEQRKVAQADNAALVEALKRQGCAKNYFLCRVDAPCSDCRARKDALSQPHPGARMLEELAALRKVAEAAREVSANPTMSFKHLDRTLDAICNQEGR